MNQYEPVWTILSQIRFTKPFVLLWNDEMSSVQSVSVFSKDIFIFIKKKEIIKLVTNIRIDIESRGPFFINAIASGRFSYSVWFYIIFFTLHKNESKYKCCLRLRDISSKLVHIILSWVFEICECTFWRYIS